MTVFCIAVISSATILNCTCYILNFFCIVTHDVIAVFLATAFNFFTIVFADNFCFAVAGFCHTFVITATVFTIRCFYITVAFIAIVKLDSVILTYPFTVLFSTA